MGMIRRDLSNNRVWKTTPGKDAENDAKFMSAQDEGSGNVSEGVNASGGPSPADVNMVSSGYDSREIEAKRHTQGETNVGKAGSVSENEGPSPDLTNFGRNGSKIKDRK